MRDDGTVSLPDASRESPPGRIQSVDRAVALLFALAAAPGGATVVDLATVCGLNRSTAWRLLGTLEDNGLVDRDPGGNRYRLGFHLAWLASAGGHESLIRRTRPVLEHVGAASGETAALAVASGHEIVYVDEAASRSVLRVDWVSRTAPLHATSAGRAMLAWLPDDEVERVLAGPLERFTDSTITNPAALRRELDATLERGYACCSGELEPNLCGVAAPVLLPGATRPAAVLSIWGAWDAARRVVRFAELGPVAVAGAQEAAHLLAAPREA